MRNGRDNDDCTSNLLAYLRCIFSGAFSCVWKSTDPWNAKGLISWRQ